MSCPTVPSPSPALSCRSDLLRTAGIPPSLPGSSPLAWTALQGSSPASGGGGARTAPEGAHPAQSVGRVERSATLILRGRRHAVRTGRRRRSMGLCALVFGSIRNLLLDK